MNEEDTLDWMKLGLDISEPLDGFKVKANDLIKMGTEDIKRNIPNISVNSVLKIARTIPKADERDLECFDIGYAEVLKKNELQPIEKLFDMDSVHAESVDEAVLSAFSDGFKEDLDFIRKYLVKEEEIQKIQKSYGLSNDGLLIYSSFLKSLESKVCANKIFKPFISRTPASFTRCKGFVLWFLGVLRKFSSLDEGMYDIKTKYNNDYFKTEEVFVFPSFAIGTKSDDDKENKEGKVTLRLSGKTQKGHVLEGYEGGKQ